jgi:hypothetical protein
VSDSGFVASDDAVLSGGVTGTSAGVGADVMGDMMDMMGAAGKDDKRAAKDVADMARHQNDGESVFNRNCQADPGGGRCRGGNVCAAAGHVVVLERQPVYSVAGHETLDQDHIMWPSGPAPLCQ